MDRREVIKGIAIGPINLREHLVCPVCGDEFDETREMERLTVSQESISDTICFIGTGPGAMRMFTHNNNHQKEEDEKLDEQETIEIEIT